MFGKVTINDIAKLVGVSKATVSYYLSGNYKKMSPATKEKIRQAIEVTGYQPSKVAQSLVTRDTKTIGVVIADITNPFISFVMKGINDTCTLHGYAATFTNSDNDLNQELDNLRRLDQEKVSGVILDSVDANNPMIKTLDNQKMVMVDRQSKNLTLDTIVSDNTYSTSKFLKKMQAAGYEDIYFVTFPITGISTREARYRGFTETVSSDPSKLITLGEVETEKKIFSIIEKAQKRTAFFMMNGPTLLEFMKMLNKTDYRYPDDFGLGSYEDLDWMEVLNPNMSCIRQDSYGLGCVAAECLIDKIKHDDQTYKPQLIEVRNDIVLRKSF
ncbi:LacI family DNA-binding transcriptional regulator [Streptococcus dentasini]